MKKKIKPDILISHRAHPPLTREESDRISDALFKLSDLVPEGSELYVSVRRLRLAKWNSSSPGITVTLEQ